MLHAALSHGPEFRTIFLKWISLCSYLSATIQCNTIVLLIYLFKNLSASFPCPALPLKSMMQLSSTNLDFKTLMPYFALPLINFI